MYIDDYCNYDNKMENRKKMINKMTYRRFAYVFSISSFY